MIEYTNECCGCATETYPCIGNVCTNINVRRYYCDKCGDEATLYYFDSGQYCIDCIECMLEKVDKYE